MLTPVHKKDSESQISNYLNDSDPIEHCLLSLAVFLLDFVIGQFSK